MNQTADKAAPIIENTAQSPARLGAWLAQEAGFGRYAREWMHAQFDRAVADVFGYHALQIGAHGCPTLASSRILYRWSLSAEVFNADASTIVADARALPFFEAIFDLITLPFALDTLADPEQIVAECARVLVPEGRLVIVGINTASLLGLQSAVGMQVWPRQWQPLGYRRLIKILRTYGLGVAAGRFGGYGTAGAYRACSLGHHGRAGWLELAGDRWWPHLGGLYVLEAIKRVPGIKLKHSTRVAHLQQVLAPINPFPAAAPHHVRPQRSLLGR